MSKENIRDEFLCKPHNDNIDSMAFLKNEQNEEESALANNKKMNTRRCEDEVYQDILKYNELIYRDQDVELDIPPRRMKSRSKARKEEHTPDNKKSLRRSRHQNRRRAHENNKIKDEQTKKAKLSNERLKQTQERFQTLKPNYFRPYSIKPIQFERTKKISMSVPPSLCNTKANNFEDQVLLNNSYQDLMKMVKTDMSCKKSNENEEETPESIDISLRWKLFYKNINNERKRFDLTNWNLNENNLPTSYNGNLHCSEDIDLFFQKLSYNSNFDICDENQDDFQTPLHDYLKNIVPLA